MVAIITGYVMTWEGMSKIAVLIVTYNPVLNAVGWSNRKDKKAKYNLEIFLVDNASENSNILKS